MAKLELVKIDQKSAKIFTNIKMTYRIPPNCSTPHFWDLETDHVSNL